jgi:hypothetical protein
MSVLAIALEGCSGMNFGQHINYDSISVTVNWLNNALTNVLSDEHVSSLKMLRALESTAALLIHLNGSLIVLKEFSRVWLRMLENN